MTDQPLLQCHAIQKRFGSQMALRSVSANLAHGECLALLGPSGCGKSTLLNIITGLLKADGGCVVCDGEVLDDPQRGRFVPLRQRRFAMVFQDFSLWPHMSVAENVAFAPRRERLPAAEREKRVRWALSRVRMEGFADRTPSQLSGGQQQRVAMARAIAAMPRVLLLDEPLSALDAVLREELRDEIASLVRDLGIATLFVTHDQTEALAIADRVAVMRDGRIEQCDRAIELYRRPATEFVARFVGAANVLEDPELGLVALRREDVRFDRDPAAGPGAAQVSAAAAAGGDPADARAWSGRVESCAFLGERFEIALSLDRGGRLRGFSIRGFEPGAKVVAMAPRERLIPLPGSVERSPASSVAGGGG